MEEISEEEKLIANVRKNNVDACVAESNPEATLVAVERFLLNQCDKAQIMEVFNSMDKKFENQTNKKDFCLKLLRKHADSVMIPRLVETWIRGFLRLIKPQLMHTFPEVTYSTLVCILKDYDNIQRKMHVNCLVNVQKTESDVMIPVWQGWRRDGRTETYTKFMKRRSFLKHRLFMFSPIIRYIIDSACENIPSTMVNFEKYRQLRSLPFNQFIHSLLEDLAVAKSVLFVGFYKDVTEILSRQSAKQGMQESNLKKLVRLITFIVEVQVTELMRRTIEDFLNVLHDEQRIPKIDITLKNENGKFLLCPLEEEVLNGYHLYINAVKNLFQEELPSLEQYVLGYDVPPFIEIQLDQSIYLSYVTNLTRLLKSHFKEVYEYTAEMDDLYGFINYPNQTDNEVAFAASNMNYVPLIERRTIYQTYDDILHEISVAYLNFFICRLLQNDVVEYLRNKVIYYRDFHTSLIMRLHQKENERIMKTYEDIMAITETVPVSPKFLVLSGKYILAIQGDLMSLFKERVWRSYKIMVMLMGWVDINEEDQKFDTTSIMSYAEMVLKIKIYNKDYEHYKVQFEDKLYNISHELSEKLEIMLPKIEMFSCMNDLEKLEVYKQDIHNMAAVFKIHEDQIAVINEEEALLDIPISGFPEYDELRAAIYPMTKLITYVDLWKTMEKKWMDGTFEDLEATAVGLTSNHIEKMIKHYQKVIKDLICQQIDACNPRRITGSIDDPANLAGPLKICEKVLEHIKKFNEKIIYISTFCNNYLRRSHWMEMKEITGLDLRPNSGTTLRKILKLRIEPDINRLQLISLGATEEAKLLRAYNNSRLEWESVSFNLIKDKQHDIVLLTDLDKLQVALDDHKIKMQIIRGSAFAKPYADIYKEWIDELILMSRNLEIWEKVQSRWLYFLPILSSIEVPISLSKEKSLFKTVDLFMKNAIKKIADKPLVTLHAGQEQLTKDLQMMHESLQTLSSVVCAFMEEVRLEFPRFFLISNEDLIDILSNPKKVVVKTHIYKLFDCLSDLIVDGNQRVTSVLSSEAETIHLKKPIHIDENEERIEMWLTQLDDEIKATIKETMKESMNDYPTKKRKDWVINWPGQIVICVSQLYWTSYVVEKFQTRQKWITIESELMCQLYELVKLVQSSIPALTRRTICNLITIDVHALDVTEETFTTNIPSLGDFQWLSRLRHYWEANNMTIKIVNASVKYGYEYLGNTTRLVLTPLTDRCFHTIMEAYHSHMYGSVEGSAGTGKTETTKDLAKALGLQCLIFHCSGVDYDTIKKFFKGLVTTGSWICFDEFSQVDPQVLSVVAELISCVLNATKEKLTKFAFEGTTLSLNANCYICITMNPERKGKIYFPDNLKVYFRAVAMVIPDIGSIAEICLFSKGFSNAREIGYKLMSFNYFCEMQLSSQYHYEFDLRSIKKTIFAAEKFKLQLTHESEDRLILRSIREVHSSKINKNDIAIFEKIVKDLFPGVHFPDLEYEELMNHLQKACLENHFLPVKPFLEKIKQINQVMHTYHGFMILGNTLSGKTSALTVLQKSLSRLHEIDITNPPVISEVINPKSVTLEQLYGYLDLQSREWSDGILPKALRYFLNKTTFERKWVILDGPIDASWVENLSTVLDDNNKLCLSSGEVIILSSNISIIFEALDLSQASPSLVSRCGVIYVDSSCLDWTNLVKMWIQNNDDKWWKNFSDLLIGLFNWTVTPCTEFINTNGKQIINLGTANLVRSTINVMDMLLSEMEESTNDTKIAYPWLQGLYVYACVWGLGGTLDYDSRQMFDEFIKSLFKGQNEEYPAIKEVLPITINFPEGLIYDYLFLCRGNYGIWKSWTDTIRNAKYDKVIKIGSPIIPTVDTARCRHMLRLHIHFKNPMILMGPSGTGKSTCIQNYLMHELPTDNYWSQYVTMTVEMTAKETQEIVLSQLFKSGKYFYKAPDRRNCVMFLDDINMPAKDFYGEQPPIELMRQYLDHQHWFDMKESHPIYLPNILLLCAMQPPGANRSISSPRFLSHFNIYSISAFSDITLCKIYRSILHTDLMNHNFGPDIIGSVIGIVNSTLKIYSDVKEHLLPTPVKCHYVFNLGDFSRVIQGCSLIHKESVDCRRVMIRLWTHEILRSFYDRILNLHEKDWLIQRISWCIKTHFKDNFENVFDYLGPVKGKAVHNTLKYLLFGSVLHTEIPLKTQMYEEMNFSKFQEVAESCLMQFNQIEKVKLDIIFFSYALEHLSRLCRVMSMPCGNSLLIGYGGLGKHSLTRIAAAMIGHKFAEINITSVCDVKEWRKGLKKILRKAGGKSRPIVLYLTDKAMSKATFSDVEALLSLGEVPNLFTLEERMECMEIVSRRAQGTRRTVNIDPLILYAYFVSCCKENLHIVLCVSPSRPTFREKLQNYPSIVKCCSMDWYERWPEEAIKRIATENISSLNLDENIKLSFIDTLASIHISSRYLGRIYFEKTNRLIYFSSESYFEMLKLCKILIPKREKELKKKNQQFSSGIEKFMSASEQAISMKKSVTEMKPELVSATERSKAMMEIIEKETIAVEKASAVVKVDELEANEKAKSAQELKDDCEKDLAQIIPILESAVQSLNTLKPADITLVKSMKNPPEAVKLVMAAVCVMMDIKPDRLNEDSSGKRVTDYWGPSKKLLSDMSFLQKLKDYDKHNISPEIMTKIRKDYIRNPMFKPKKVKKASRAAEGLCKWVLAMSNFDEVEKIVAPKREKLEIAEREYSATYKALERKRGEVRDLENKISELKSSLEATDEHRKYLQDACELSTVRLARAERLIDGLSGEEKQWIEAVRILEKSLINIYGDVLLSSAFIAYLSAFENMYRAGFLTHWKKLFKEKKLSFSKDYIFHKVMSNEENIQEYYCSGLPKDAGSTNNAVITENSIRFCLMIDPQLQANKWIRNMEIKNSLKVIKPQDFNFRNVIELSITHGIPVLLENFEGSIDIFLNPVLKKECYVIDGIWSIALGTKIVTYNKNFRLYITSRLAEPNFTAEISALVTIVNFTLAKEGLEDQLLGIAVAMAKPQLEKKWESLVLIKDENKRKLFKIQNDVLTILSSALGNLLDNESTITALDSSKVLASDLRAKQTASIVDERKIEAERNCYKNLANYASKLFYSLNHLPTLNSMYQFSLNWFIDIFKASFLSRTETSTKSLSMERLQENFLYNFYCSVCRSILDEDKLLFTFLLALSLVRSEMEISAEECDFFATGGMGIGFVPENPAKNWLSETSWKSVFRLCNLQCFTGFLEKFKVNSLPWKNIYQSNEPQKQLLPRPWEKRLTSFQKLLLTRAFRADKVKTAIEEFVLKILGAHYLSAPSFDISESFALSRKTTPLLLILVPGVDPMLDLVNFASSQNVHADLEIVSLGQGQDQLAENAIKNAQNKGYWVCLQNCHLAGTWMLDLECIACSIPESNSVEEGFRLWLTCLPNKKVPLSIVQTSIKMVKEAPSGLKKNLLQSFSAGPIADTSFYANYRDKNSILRRYMFSVCFFHAVVTERRKFGALGWKEIYNFDESDLYLSLRQIDVLLRDKNETPFESMRYLVGECNYGGKVRDEQDRLVLSTLLSDYICPKIETEFYPNLTESGPPFYLPVSGSYSDYIDFIKDLPDTFGPEIYGLHENANIAKVKMESVLICNKLIHTIVKPCPNELEKFSEVLLDLIDMILEIPRNFKNNFHLRAHSQPKDEWMNLVLQHEMERFNTLTSEIHHSLELLKRCLKGMDFMNTEIEKLGLSLLWGDIPETWMSVSYASLKSLGSYVADLKNRLSFFQDWNDNGQPTEFWISGFFHPRSFVYDIMQNFASEIQVLFGNVKVLGFSKNADLQSGICIYGLFIEGASWNQSSSCLEESEPGILYSEMPKLDFIPVDSNIVQEVKIYSCPIYNTSERKESSFYSCHSCNYIVSIDLKTMLPKCHWIKRGTALLCQMDN